MINALMTTENYLKRMVNLFEKINIIRVAKCLIYQAFVIFRINFYKTIDFDVT